MNLNKMVLLAAAITIVHFQRELHLGQVNQLLLLMYLLVCRYLQKNKPVAMGIVLSLSIFIKPFGLIFLPYLLVKSRYREFVFTLISAVILFAMPLLFFNFGMFINQNIQWYNELIIELGNKQNLLQAANHTIFSIIARYTGIGYLLVSSIYTSIFQFIILVLIAIFILWFIQLSNNNDKGIVAELALLISIIPLLSFTSHNAFGFATLLVMIILHLFTSFSIYTKVIVITAFAFVGGNYNDLWGSNISGIINDYSFVSIGVLTMISILAIERYRNKV